MAVTGWIFIECPRCDGAKNIYVNEDGTGTVCPYCNGKGKILWGKIKDKDDPDE